MSDTPIDVAKVLEEAHAKSTPGLWGWCTTGEKCNAAMLGTFYTFDDACTPLGGHVERYGENGKQVADWDEDIAYKEDNARYADFDFIALAHNLLPALLARLREAEAVVSRLPKTADGMPIVPHEQTTVWVNWNGQTWAAIGMQHEGDSEWSADPWKFCPIQNGYRGPDTFEPDDCYSTRAAAEAAHNEGSRQ